MLPKYEEFLTEAEQRAVELFITNDLQREAVKKILLFELNGNGILEKGKPADPYKNYLISLVQRLSIEGVNNEELGQRLRSSVDGITLLEVGFDNLAKCKKEPEKPKAKTNSAR